MKKQFLAIGVVCASLFAWAAQSSDPVLMKIAGKDVRLSEFEYLYHKNSAQQANPQTLDEYVDMFIDYKLKVAAAEAAGIDTTQAFLKEYGQFRSELSRPYLRDNSVLDSLVAESYNHMTHDITVSHIMLPDGKEALLDSLRTAIISGATTFEEVAQQYSVDKPSAARGGLMGVVGTNRYPWAFEQAAYNTAVGDISPVINSGYGLHIIRVEKDQPSKGEVLVEHILRLTRGVTDSVAAVEANRIDSIYNVVTAPGADFADVASRLSQDPGSARKGGKLDWFGAGMMVKEFDSIAFALPVGAYSKPFRTSYGWHIIHKLDQRSVASLEDSREAITAAINRDDRGRQPEFAYLSKQIVAQKAKMNKANVSKVAALADKLGGQLDSAMIAEFGKSSIEMFTVNGKKTTLAEIASSIHPSALKGGDNIANHVEQVATQAMNEAVLNNSRDALLETNADYRNLINEYRDGILLFEISNRNVWDYAAKDKDGVEAYFKANRDKYAWDQPKYKAVIVFAPADSTLNDAMAYAESLPKDMESADFVAAMRDKFPRDVKVERVIAAKGENAITDYLGFGGEKPAPTGRWSSYAAFNGRVIPAPEEAADVRGAVVSDYQSELERNWLADLHAKYPVKVDQKVLKQVK
jgi:peptidyl-prolyl cis-trans isomerase SurA